MSMQTENVKKSHRKYYLNNKEVIVERNRRNTQKAKDYIANSKKGKSCADCGFSDDRILHFHHLKDKSFTIGKAADRRMSIEKIQAEIDKCILLCPNCHAIRHLDNVGSNPFHN